MIWKYIDDCEEIDEVCKRMNSFVQKNDNIMIFMDLELESVNGTSYEQNFLAGTFLNGKVVHNSFVEVKTKNEEEKNQDGL